MMTYFNELNTQGVDRDEALFWLSKVEDSKFTESQNRILLGCLLEHLGHWGLLSHLAERSMWAAAILAKMLPKGHLFGHRIFSSGADNELYQTINTALIRLEYFDIFKNTDEHIDVSTIINQLFWWRSASMLIELSKRLKAGS